MSKYVVRIETSVTVDAIGPDEALNLARDWAEESLTNSNAIGRVYGLKRDGERKGPLLMKKQLD